MQKQYLAALSLLLVSNLLVGIGAGPATARDTTSEGGLADCRVLIVRHGEKPDSGPELSAAGVERAKKICALF